MITKDRSYLFISTVITARAKKISDAVEEEDGIEFQYTTVRYQTSDREIRNVESAIKTIPGNVNPAFRIQ